MKIAGVIIQNRNITVNTEKEFEAKYKGKRIYITSNHGHGKPKESHLNRYDIDVIDDSGMYTNVLITTNVSTGDGGYMRRSMLRLYFFCVKGLKFK